MKVSTSCSTSQGNLTDALALFFLEHDKDRHGFAPIGVDNADHRIAMIHSRKAALDVHRILPYPAADRWSGAWVADVAYALVITLLAFPG
jgi:hypothetical protein